MMKIINYHHDNNDLRWWEDWRCIVFVVVLEEVVEVVEIVVLVVVVEVVVEVVVVEVVVLVVISYQ